MLSGWLFGITMLKSLVLGLATMKANTAFCFVVAGIALWLLGRPRKQFHRYVTLLSLLITVVGGLTLSEYAFSWNLGIDELLFRDIQNAGSAGNSLPGRMAPATALNVFLIGVALALLNSSRIHWLAHLCAHLAAINAGLALVGYLYGVSSLYRIAEYASVAIHTAVVSLLLAAGILFVRPDRGLMVLVTSDSLGGTVVRRLLPVFLVLPVAFGWFRLEGQRAGHYDTEFGTALLVITMTLSFSALIFWIGIAISRVDRRRYAAEESLRQSEETYRLLFESNPHPMWVYDLQTLAFLAVNDAAIVHYGYSQDEFQSMTMFDIRPPEDSPLLEDAVRIFSPEAPTTAARRHQKKDGTIIDVEATSRELEIGGRRARLVLATDITERKHLEDQLRQSQKLEAIGLLAGGIAHDFNNLLTAIIGYSQIIMGRLDRKSPWREELEEIEKAGLRAASLTAQLVAFSRKQLLHPKVLQLNEIISQVDKLLRRLIGEDIDLVTVGSPDLETVKADPGQIEQILVNLAVNSRDAMPRGGKLTIETMNVDLDENYANAHAEVTPGKYVMVAVSDTGHGMDSETASRVFEPFFTTKEQGKGTGLGLSTVYGIVKQSGGHIWLYSEVGRGTTFKIYFPRVDEFAASADVETAAIESIQGAETILLVEDDEAVRNLATRALEMYGYTVLAAERGAQALEAFGPLASAIDLVITDVVMPEMSGADLVAKLKELHPEVRFLYVSGYTEEATIHHGVLDQGIAFLQKPFTPISLARKVREVLDIN